ncbi:L-PSP family endoribonuclease [Pandoraea terrae]|uniref:L-PSP family endoribonuclease n=1 Tax=Pandoraea terrae TaxID=1537710 RepID=A0A5E4Y3Y8_9BURK|nr:RidA family protein [Pandoraea terrae]VVE43391.1 L-PSP family endoribonuclease [Pandoraea terrae]
MSETIEKRLAQLGVELPTPAKGVASYVPVIRVGDTLVTSGQLPLKDGQLMSRGLLGSELDVAQGQLAAKWCAANVLAQAKAALGDLERIQRLVKITVFVASAPDFCEQHVVANGASDLFVSALGDKGQHARSAVGVAALPMNAAVEVEATFEVA